MWKCCVAVSIHQNHFIPRDTLDRDSGVRRSAFKRVGGGLGSKLGPKDSPAHDLRLGVMIEAELGTELETELDEKKERVHVKLTLEVVFAFAVEDLGSDTSANL